MSNFTKCLTCTGPVNIATIKYWGKRDEKLILPINGSLSGTLHQDQLRAKTSIMASPNFKEDRMWLNGQEQSLDSPRLQNVLKEIRRRARKRSASPSKQPDLAMLDWNVHISSENNFPTAAGLASSAAGYACLVFTLAKLFNVEGEISDIARQGSGSACRSVYGGFVEWIPGEAEDGSDSIARQVASETHWSDMRVLILVVSADKKPVGSTAGMQTSVKTSELLRHRATNVVPKYLNQMRQAVLEKDFPAFAEATMRESNQLHAVCLDTYPPISYMTDVSHSIVRMVHALNDYLGQVKVAYTFDAGPNACLYLLEKDVPVTLGLVQYMFPPKEGAAQFVRGIEVQPTAPTQELVNSMITQPNPGALQYVISTKIGPGPQVLDDPSECLLTEEGLPKLVN